MKNSIFKFPPDPASFFPKKDGQTGNLSCYAENTRRHTADRSLPGSGPTAFRHRTDIFFLSAHHQNIFGFQINPHVFFILQHIPFLF